MPNIKNDILEDVAQYYSRKLSEYGETARGVDWNSEESQAVRFKQLCKIIDSRESFAVNDVGCGYGALYSYLAAHHKTFKYYGCDISNNMIRAAHNRYGEKDNAVFNIAEKPTQAATYGIASGIFNVRLSHEDDTWRKHLQGMLEILNGSSTHAFAFNCLTSYSDKDKMKDYLYYAEPCELFDFCKRRYSRDVALLQDYGLYEFTILVRKRT